MESWEFNTPENQQKCVQAFRKDVELKQAFDALQDASGTPSESFNTLTWEDNGETIQTPLYDDQAGFMTKPEHVHEFPSGLLEEDGTTALIIKELLKQNNGKLIDATLQENFIAEFKREQKRRAENTDLETKVNNVSLRLADALGGGFGYSYRRPEFEQTLKETWTNVDNFNVLFLTKRAERRFKGKFWKKFKTH